MPLFNLSRDEKVVIWHRIVVEVDASTQQEAVAILATTPGLTHPAIKDVSETRPLWGSESILTPDDLEPEATLVILGQDLDNDPDNRDDDIELWNNEYTTHDQESQ